MEKLSKHCMELLRTVKQRKVKPRMVMTQLLGQPPMVRIEQLELRLHDSLYVRYTRTRMVQHKLLVKLHPVQL